MKQVFVTTAFAIASAALVFGCASETTGPSTGPSSETGSVALNIAIDGEDVTSVAFRVACDAGTLTGNLNVNDENDPPIAATVMDLPPGECTVTLTASNAQGEVLCTGSTDFTVVANQTVPANVVLQCGVSGEELLGNVNITGEFEFIVTNRCPRLHFLNAVPDEVPAEGSEVTVLVSDADGDTLETALTATGGSFADPTALLTTYFCDDATGGQTISVTVTDGDPECNKSKSFDVTCPGVNLCEGVTCEDTGNPCTVAECNPANGLCEESNVANDTVCEGSAVELAVNGGFETGNLDGWTQFCTENNGTCAATTDEANTGSWSGNLVASVPEGGPASFPLIKNANIGIGTVTPNSPISISFAVKGELTGISGQVVAEFFSEQLPEGTSKSEILQIITPTSEWVTYSFETTTGPVVDNGVTLQLKVECGAVPGCGNNTYFDDVSVTFGSGGGAGTCQEGVCEPIVIDLCEGNTCDDDDTECSDSSCDAGTGQCVSTPINEGNDCDGGAGTCQAGVCEPTVIDLCEGNTCDDDDTECSDSSCDAGTGQCVSTPINEGNDCDGGAGTCNAGVCEPFFPYEQNFNGLDINGAVIGDDWVFFANVFDSGGNFKFFYSGAAPNGTGNISAIVDDQGGPNQIPQQLDVFSDYSCCGTSEGHFGTDLVEINVFQERTIAAGDDGKTLTFTFDAKAGNVEPPTTALAFIKTLDPNAGFFTTNFVTVDTANLSTTDWDTLTISLVIDASLVGQILQFGFQNTASGFAGSGVFYDNVLVTVE